jgi:hypothetical protein
VSGRSWLLLAGWLSVAASALHLAAILGGPAWYRALGAGEEMAEASARGLLTPTLITLFIAAVLAVWAAYAFSSAGWLPRLPLTRTALVAISTVLLLRGLGVPLMTAWRPDLSTTFIATTAVIVTAYGAVFATGTVLAWTRLAPPHAL